jgi:hypothetical protein
MERALLRKLYFSSGLSETWLGNLLYRLYKIGRKEFIYWMLRAQARRRRDASLISGELERDFIESIYRIGFRSFILVLIGPDPANRQSVYCQSQDTIGEFLEALARVPRFTESLLDINPRKLDCEARE